MRLQFGITGGLIVIAIVVLLLTGGGAREDASLTDTPSTAPTQQTLPSPNPTASPLPGPPEWVATTSADALTDFYFASSILELSSGMIWHITAPGREPPTSGSLVFVELVGWTPQGEALIAVSEGERTALYAGPPGGDIRYLITAGSAGRRQAVMLSPDGTLAAIGQSIIELAGGEPVIALLPGSWIGWSADGRFFAMEDDSGEVPRILAWDRTTGIMLEQASATEGVWSNTGHRLAYEPARPAATEPRQNQILVRDFVTGTVTVVMQVESFRATPIDWSRNDDFLVVSATQFPPIEGRTDEYHILDPATQETLAIVQGAWSPAWSSTSDHIVFIGNICAGFDIFTLRADGTGLTNYTSSDDLDLWPHWAPNGRDLAFISYRDDAVKLMTIDTDLGTESTPISAPRDAMGMQSWSPDGSYITFRYGGGRGLCEGGQPEETAVTILP